MKDFKTTVKVILLWILWLGSMFFTVSIDIFTGLHIGLIGIIPATYAMIALCDHYGIYSK